jgi:hypothetical protein
MVTCGKRTLLPAETGFLTLKSAHEMLHAARRIARFGNRCTYREQTVLREDQRAHASGIATWEKVRERLDGLADNYHH